MQPLVSLVFHNVSSLSILIVLHLYVYVISQEPDLPAGEQNWMSTSVRNDGSTSLICVHIKCDSGLSTLLAFNQIVVFQTAHVS